MSEMKKSALLKHIQMCEFVVAEIALYLDTHKMDKEALTLYNTHREMLERYRKEYSEKYGPLSIFENNDDKVWNWVNSPWPWEYGSEV